MKFKLLGTLLNENVAWTEHVDEVTSSWYRVLATLRKIKNMTSQQTKKSLVQSLVLSKLNFNDSVTYPPTSFLQKRVQRIQNAAAGFVLNRFCSERDVLELGWLLIKGTLQDSLATLFNALPANVRRCPDFNTFANDCCIILRPAKTCV